jgi:hypothetical protein
MAKKPEGRVPVKVYEKDYEILQKKMGQAISKGEDKTSFADMVRKALVAAGWRRGKK